MSEIYIPDPYRYLILNITEWYKNRHAINEKIRSRGYTVPFIQPKAEYLFDITFSDQLAQVEDIKVVFLFTLNGYCWWFDKGEDITFVDSFQRFCKDLSFYTAYNNIIDLLEAMKQEFNLNDMDIARQEWIMEQLWDVKWCLAGLFGMIIYHGNSRSVNEYEWHRFLNNN